MRKTPPRNDTRRLTERQKECMVYLAQDLSDKDIAAKLHISVSAATSRLEKAMDNAKCPTRSDLIDYAKELYKQEIPDDDR